MTSNNYNNINTNINILTTLLQQSKAIEDIHNKMCLEARI